MGRKADTIVEKCIDFQPKEDGSRESKEKKTGCIYIENNHLQGNVEVLQAHSEGRVFAKTSNTEESWSIWSAAQKKGIILSASFASLFSPLFAQIYFPAPGVISTDLYVSATLVNLSITIYLIFQAITPNFTAQLSDTAGRRPSYITCFILHIAANIGLGIQNGYVALMVLRCLQSTGSIGTVASHNLHY